MSGILRSQIKRLRPIQSRSAASTVIDFDDQISGRDARARNARQTGARQISFRRQPAAAVQGTGWLEKRHRQIGVGGLKTYTCARRAVARAADPRERSRVGQREDEQ